MSNKITGDGTLEAFQAVDANIRNELLKKIGLWGLIFLAGYYTSKRKIPLFGWK